MSDEAQLGARKRCGRCDVSYVIGEPSTTYVKRYSCAGCGIPFWEQSACGSVTLGIEERNANRLPQAHTGKKVEA